MLRGASTTSDNPIQDSIIIVCIFVFFVALDLYMGITGMSWSMLSTAEIQFWAVIITLLSTAITGGVLINLFYYSRGLSNMRGIILVLLAMDILLINFFHLMTHPTSIFWSPFADRIRNRSVVAIAGTAVMLSVFLFAYARDVPYNLKKLLLYGGFGGIVFPIISMLCVISPQPLLIMTTETGGLAGLTPTGIVLSVAMPFIGIWSFFKCITEYRQYRDTLVLSLALALILWSVASIYMTLLWNPLQIAEVLYMLNVMGGMTTISIALAIDTLWRPIKQLEQEVAITGRELHLSRQEAEMFLSAWAHKMGNLLQGITLYMELIAECKTDSERTGLAIEASMLTAEANRLNRQVNWLWTVKSAISEPLYNTDIAEVINRTLTRIHDMFGGVSISYRGCKDPTRILVDDNADLLFIGLISYCLHKGGIESTKIDIWCNKRPDGIILSLQIKGPLSAYEVMKVLQSNDLPDVTGIDLDIYTARVLFHRYNGVAEIDIDDESILHLKFPISD